MTIPNDQSQSDPALVSIIMPTHNRGDLLGESIQSVIDQTYPHWELIIIDDGSTDQTREVISSFNDKRIDVHYMDHTGLVGKMRNMGIGFSKGSWIAFQDSDDIWLSNKLKIQMRLLGENPDASFIIGNNYQIGENATAVPEYDSTFVGNMFRNFLVDNSFHFCGTSLVFNRAVLATVGMMEESVRMMREFQFFLKMSAHYKGIFSHEKLVKVRRHTRNTSNQYHIQAYTTLISIINDFHREGLISWRLFRKLTARYEYKTGLTYLNDNDPRAREAFVRSWLSNPFYAKSSVRVLQSLMIR
jgi:glycosyltransferase involved in cell wall biosynthesis